MHAYSYIQLLFHQDHHQHGHQEQEEHLLHHSQATGTYSRKAFQKCGFDLVADVKYAQFKIGEKRVFAGIQGHEGVAFMAKLLD